MREEEGKRGEKEGKKGKERGREGRREGGERDGMWEGEHDTMH
jgi:hypothetical protein